MKEGRYHIHSRRLALAANQIRTLLARAESGGSCQKLNLTSCQSHVRSATTLTDPSLHTCTTWTHFRSIGIIPEGCGTGRCVRPVVCVLLSLHFAITQPHGSVWKITNNSAQIEPLCYHDRVKRRSHDAANYTGGVVDYSVAEGTHSTSRDENFRSSWTNVEIVRCGGWEDQKINNPAWSLRSKMYIYGAKPLNSGSRCTKCQQALDKSHTHHSNAHSSLPK
jgi:hypothetical protein